jgi:hypothetical protein
MSTTAIEITNYEADVMRQFSEKVLDLADAESGDVAAFIRVGIFAGKAALEVVPGRVREIALTDESAQDQVAAFASAAIAVLIPLVLAPHKDEIWKVFAELDGGALGAAVQWAKENNGH